MRKRRAAPGPAADDDDAAAMTTSSDEEEEKMEDENSEEELPEVLEAWSNLRIGDEGLGEYKELKEGKRGEKIKKGESKEEKKDRDPKLSAGLKDAVWGDETWDAEMKLRQESAKPTEHGQLKGGPWPAREYFGRLFTHSLWLRLRAMTNQRAAEKKIVGWEPLEFPELHAWIGINIFMGIHRLPNTRMYWDRKYGVDRVRNVMTCLRFETIKKCWSFTDINLEHAPDHPAYDPFYKVRPLLDELNRVFPLLWSPGAWTAVDERMVAIAFKGKHKSKQFVERKPDKWGFKLWELSCASTGYMLAVIAYIGAADGAAGKEEALGTEVVCNFLQPYSGTERAVAVDNFFGSVDLAQKLWMMEVGMVGTVKSNRMGMPEQFRGRKLAAAKKQLKPW